MVATQEHTAVAVAAVPDCVLSNLRPCRAFPNKIYPRKLCDWRQIYFVALGMREVCNLVPGLRQLSAGIQLAAGSRVTYAIVNKKVLTRPAGQYIPPTAPLDDICD